MQYKLNIYTYMCVCGCIVQLCDKEYMLILQFMTYCLDVGIIVAYCVQWPLSRQFIFYIPF